VRLQDIYNTVKKDCILILGDRNARFGNTKTIEIIRKNGEPTTSNIERKLTDFSLLNNVRITKFLKGRRHSQIYMVCALNEINNR
jgi:hypothetical protein